MGKLRLGFPLFILMANKTKNGIDSTEAPAGSWSVPDKINPGQIEDRDYRYSYGDQPVGIPDEVDD